MGARTGPFTSMTGYAGDPVVMFTMMFLIVMGGIGFLVWEDLFIHKWHWKKYHLHTKMVITMTAVLIIGPAVFYFFVERHYAFQHLSTGGAIIASLFQSITLRTAGYASVDPTAFTQGSCLLSIVLMLVGASPGSTGGGMKTTTFFVVVLSLSAVVRNKPDLHCFKRRIDDDLLRRACAIFFVYLSAAILASIALCVLEPLGLDAVLFEVVSALCTVGISMGITPMLSGLSKIIIIALMFFGRVGVLSIIVALTGTSRRVPIQYPSERVMIG